jgi:K+/H+ antiporter YhaU regulatory subunit KhtT
VDAQKIAEQVKAAISQVQPGAGLAKQITGEVLMEIGESAFIVESDGSDGQVENDSKVRRPLQIRRITASAAAMPEVMKKLEEITKRLEAIETRLDKIEQP